MEAIMLSFKDNFLNLILFILILIVALFGGKCALKKLNPNKKENSQLDQFVFSVGLGFGIIGYLMLGIGFLGLLYKSVAYFILLFSLLLAIYINNKKLIKLIILSKEYIEKFLDLKFTEKILVLFIIIVSVINLMAALAPPSAQDALSSYLAIPKIFFQNHRIFYLRENYISNIPLLPSFIYLFGLMLHSGTIGQLIHWLFGISASITIFAIGRTYSRSVGLLSSALFICLQPVIWESSQALTDLATVFFLSLGFYAFVKWIIGENNKYIILSGIFLGFASGCKGFGPLYTGAFAVMVFIHVLIKKGFKNAFKIEMVFLFSFLAIAGVWYLKAYLTTGNPFFPAFFGGRGVTPELLTEFWTSYGKANAPLSSIKNLFLFPINVTFFPNIYGGWIGPLYLTFIFFIMLFKEKSDKIVLSIFAYCLILFSLMCVLGVQFDLRWYLIFFALLAIPVSIVCHNFVNSYAHKSISSLTIIAVFVWLGFSSIYAAWKKFPALPVVMGIETRNHYLQRMIPEDANFLKAFEFINNNLPKGTKILYLGSRGYYLDREYIRFWRLTTGYLNVKEIVEPDDLLNALKKIGITHVLIDNKIAEKQASRFGIQDGYKLLGFVRELVSKKKFPIVHKVNECFLYQI